jgi:hypothetical protein
LTFSFAKNSAHQETTVEGCIRDGKERVTITDPRHPLYGRDFRLVKIYQSKGRVSQCVIEIIAEVHRTVPLAVTDLSEARPTHSPLPLSLDSVQELVVAFSKLNQFVTENNNDGTPQATTPQADRTAATLALTQPRDATSAASAIAPALSKAAQSTPQPGESR